jgi:hypothetical protein
MKVGAENRTKVIAASVLGLLAVILVGYELSGWFTGNSSSAAAPLSTTSTDLEKPPARTPRAVKPAKGSKVPKQDTARNLDPTLRLDLLRASEDTKYQGTGRNIFKMFVEIPHVVKSPVQPQEPQVAKGPPPPAPPPPSNLKFYGFATPQNGIKRIFLIKNSDVFVAKEGEIVDRRYKVVRISPNSVEILDVLSNNRENIPLTQG